MSDNYVRVIGIDPGPTPGLVRLSWRTDDWSGFAPSLAQVDVVQCSHLIAGRLVSALAAEGVDLVAVEQFVVGHRAGRSSTSTAGYTTRSLVAELVGMAEVEGWRNVQRPAGTVKPWATTSRLKAAGLLDLTEGMRHARDAARHALFAGVRDLDMPDPLSVNAR